MASALGEGRGSTLTLRAAKRTCSQAGVVQMANFNYIKRFPSVLRDDDQSNECEGSNFRLHNIGELYCFKTWFYAEGMGDSVRLG